MCTISIDRYCVVVHPLGPRITNVVPLGVVLAVIWLISFTLAIPFAIYNEVVEVKWIFRRTVRCRAIVPSEEYNKALTMLSFLTQYLVPLTIASVAYASIAFSMKKRSKLGAMTREQISRILKTNRQTITMLVLCLITFAASWLPLHIFCLYRDFFNPNIHQTKVWLTVHWLAMSSVVYNPWIYSARNKHFRNGMKNFFRYLVFKRQNSESTINGLENGASMTQLTRVPSNRPLRGSYLCHVNRNHSLTRSFCNRAQTCMRSSSSSLEESSLQNTITSLRNGKAQHSVVVAKCATGRTASDSIIAKQTPVIDCTNRSNSNSAKMPASDTLHSVFASSDRESKAAETIASRSTPLLTGKMNSLPRLDNNRSSAMNGTLRHNVSLLNDVGSSNGVEDFKKCTTVSTALFAVDPTADSNNNEESPV